MRFRSRPAFQILHAAATGDVPVYAHWGITHRCGLTCQMCGIWRYGNKKEELSLPQIKNMAQRMKRIGVAHLAIGGGEPFEREDLAEVCRLFIEEGIELRVLTNGVTTDPALLDRVIDAGVRNFSVSFDTLFPHRYDAICEREGSWKKGLATMLHIARRTLPMGGLPTINCVVSHINLEELPELVRFARAIGFHISFLPVELLPDSNAGVQNWEARFIRYRPEMCLKENTNAPELHDRVARIYRTIRSMKRRGMPILNTSAYLKASQIYLGTGQYPPETCDAGKLYFSVAPNGEFTICHRKAYAHRSFLDPDFEQYFSSENYETKRHKEASGCEGCMRACWIDTSYIFHTVRGFMETAWVVHRPKRTEVPSLKIAALWAKELDEEPLQRYEPQA